MAGPETNWTSEMMYELGTRHAVLETAGDLEGTMATLIEVPIYEFWPMGKRMVGQDRVLRYYEHLVNDFMPRQIGVSLIEETISPGALSQEYLIELNGPDGPESHRVHHAYQHHTQNYADLPIWDLLFGTYHNPKGSPKRCGFNEEKEAAMGSMLTFKDVPEVG